VPINIDSDAFSALVRGNKRRLAQVLTNLLENAERHANGAVGITLEADDEYVWLIVEDSGEGVPESERELVFERFSRGKEAGRRGISGGTGLGLALVAEHVRLHQGRVWVEERHDGESGARFVVELPRIA
jgi:signal transduction histidine kinase